MKVVDLLNRNNYVTYSLTLASKIGTLPAIYINELIKYVTELMKLKEIEDSKQFFPLHRYAMFSNTGITEEEQIEIEKLLVSLKVIEQCKKEDKISLNLDVLTSILCVEDEKIVKDLTDIVSKAKYKRTSKEGKIAMFKKYIATTNPELRKALEDWIEAVFEKQGWMNKVMVQTAEQVVDDFSNHNLDVALKLVEIATISSYRDMTWAINVFNRDFRKNFNIQQTTTLKKEVTKSTIDEKNKVVF